MYMKHVLGSHKKDDSLLWHSWMNKLHPSRREILESFIESASTAQLTETGDRMFAFNSKSKIAVTVPFATPVDFISQLKEKPIT